MGKAAKRKAPKRPAVVVKRSKPKPKPKKGKIMAIEKDDKFAPPKAEPKPAPKEPPAGGSAGAYSEVTASVPPAELLTEQEKDTSSEVPGVGPASASETSPGPVETIEDLGIGPREPYPTSDAPPPVADGLKKGSK